MKGLFGIIIVVVILLALYHYVIAPKLNAGKDEKAEEKAVLKKFGFTAE